MRSSRTTALFLALLCAAAPARALTESVEHDGCKVSVSAPDWIWQGRTVNVIATARNASSSDRIVVVKLSCPHADTNSFALPAALSASDTVPAGTTARLAITGIVPERTAERRTYPLEVEIRIGESSETVPYPLRVIRGSLVESATWSILLPTLVGLLWSISFAIILPRLSKKGAWKTVGPAVEEPTEKEAWFTNE